jgi:hypothetical protein
MNCLPKHIQPDERCIPPDDETLYQPFQPGAMSDLAGVPENIDRECLALALSQLTAARLLLPLVEVETGEALLRYRVDLRAQVDTFVVEEIKRALETQWHKLGWEQLGQHTFLCVIGAGVAACIDTTPGEEQLCLRYASELAHEMFHAGCAPDAWRSRLFLQTTLYEKFNALLKIARAGCWQWL